ncbi:DNA polymerase III subunit beta [uncultured Novosphingobium sp.]|uniref:DNA polymerase III subunit beta n=1 Tax=uncultured Novosphingobium sp. TaxID=292277 RepID=UPI0025911B6B|nr:DNA polymerase III subunit beta [uncultured Novosphingobium sp.]
MGRGNATDTRAPKTRIKAGTLKAAIEDVIDIVESRNTIPILCFVLLRVQKQRITLTATDLDCWAVRDCASDDRDGPGSNDWLARIRDFAVALPAKALKDLLAEFDGDAMVTIEAPADIDAKWSGRITIKAGRASFKLQALPVADFPDVAGVEVEFGFELPCSALADSLAGVKHAISTEETRYYLNGVYLHPVDLEVRFAATDGHRLARWTLDGPDGAASFPPVIVARKTVGIVDKLLASAIKAADRDGSPPEVLIEADGAGRLLRFAMRASDGGEVELIAKTIDGQFPDYTRVIPVEAPHRAILDKAILAEAVKRVAVLVSDKSRCVKAIFSENMLTLMGVSAELGEATEEVPCEYLGPDLTFGLDSKYWRQALAAIASDKIAMAFVGAYDAENVRPVRVAGWSDNAETPTLLQVLMPVRV